MRRCLQIALMASLTAISFLSTFSARAQSGAQLGGGAISRAGMITSTTDESGRRIYVNDGSGEAVGAVSRSASLGDSTSSRSSLVYWSSTEHRFKPVPTSGAVMRAARSAASEVSHYIDGKGPNYQYLNRAFTQQDIDAAIDAAAARHNVDPSLVRSVVKVESNFNPNAVSRKGAMGLMQLMPQTARQLNVVNPFDPEQNVDAGVRHLKKLMENYGGDVKLSLAAYNAGAGAVARSAGIPRFGETRNYVKRITQLYYSGTDVRILGSPIHEPVRVQRDSRGVLYFSNTD